MLKGPFPFLDKKMTIFDLTWSTGPGVQSTLHLGPWWRDRQSNRPRVSPCQGPPQFHVDQNINHVFGRSCQPCHPKTILPNQLDLVTIWLIDQNQIKAVMKLRTEEAEEAMQQLEEVLMMMIINIINIMILVFINIIIMITWSARGGATLAHDDDHYIDTRDDCHHRQNF